MITYTLKKGGEIECTGYKSTFKLEDLKANMDRSEKYIKEFTSNAEVKKTILDNIEQHHPFIKKMKPEDIFTCAMYNEAKMDLLTYENKTKEFKASLRKDKAELKEILAQIPELNTDEK